MCVYAHMQCLFTKFIFRKLVKNSSRVRSARFHLIAFITDRRISNLMQMCYLAQKLSSSFTNQKQQYEIYKKFSVAGCQKNKHSASLHLFKDLIWDNQL